MKKLVILIIVSFISAGIVCSQNSDRLPVIVLYETNHWTFYPGSESPAFALYDDGTVIFTTKDDNGFDIKYFYEVLDSSSFYKFIKDLNYNEILSKEDPDNILADYTSQPENFFYVYNGEKMGSVRYYGNLRSNNSCRRKASNKVVDLFDKLAFYKSDKAKLWQPERYELLVQTGKTNDAKLWNDSLPDLNSSNTVKIDTSFYSLFLTPEQYKIFERLSSSKPKEGNFIINGRECFILVRYPFPKEELWMR